jgi:hypothetical protein
MRRHIIERPMILMNEDDYIWFYQALTEAFSSIRRLPIKQCNSQSAVNGEIYTRIRAMLASSNLRKDSPIRSLFKTRRKHIGIKFDQLKQHDKERIQTMFNDIKTHHLDKAVSSTDSTLQELENILISMRSSVKQMEDAANRSTEVRSDIDKLDEFLGEAR